MGNRVEDLEKQVAELQAAVDGLTEELVETKERLRQLENATDLSAEETTNDSADRGESHAEFVPNEDATPSVDEAEGSTTDEQTEEEDVDDSDDSIIVA